MISTISARPPAGAEPTHQRCMCNRLATAAVAGSIRPQSPPMNSVCRRCRTVPRPWLCWEFRCWRSKVCAENDRLGLCRNSTCGRETSSSPQPAISGTGSVFPVRLAIPPRRSFVLAANASSWHPENASCARKSPPVQGRAIWVLGASAVPLRKAFSTLANYRANRASVILNFVGVSYGIGELFIEPLPRE